MTKQPKILPPPDERPSHLPLTGKWLSGEGAGSWFVIEETRTKLQYRITRLSPGGMIECEGDYITNYPIKLDEEFLMDYPSHCAKVAISQFGRRITLSK